MIPAGPSGDSSFERLDVDMEEAAGLAEVQEHLAGLRLGRPSSLVGRASTDATQILCSAIEEGKFDLAESLVREGADYQAQVTWRGDEKMYPLRLAIKKSSEPDYTKRRDLFKKALCVARKFPETRAKVVVARTHNVDKCMSEHLHPRLAQIIREQSERTTITIDYKMAHHLFKGALMRDGLDEGAAERIAKRASSEEEFDVSCNWLEDHTTLDLAAALGTSDDIFALVQKNNFNVNIQMSGLDTSLAVAKDYRNQDTIQALERLK